MRKSLTGIAAAGVLVLGGAVAPTAALADGGAKVTDHAGFERAPAWTKDGDTTCNGGALRGVRGEDQRLADRLTLRINGNIVFNETNVYVGSYVSNMSGYGTWSASSLSLLDAGSYGFCEPL